MKNDTTSMFFGSPAVTEKYPTARPLVVTSRDNHYGLCKDNGSLVAKVYARKDAELFAASPELYRALIQLEFEVSRQEGISPMLADALEDARVVLQKLI